MFRIKELCAEKKKTMKELGTYIGVSESAVSMYANGKRLPDCITLSRIADFFEVSADFLLSRTNYKHMATSIELTTEEALLIKSFRAVSDEGRFEILRYVEYASERYKKDTYLPGVEAK